MVSQKASNHVTDTSKYVKNELAGAINCENKMASFYSNSNSKVLPSMEWKRPIGTAERFYLGDDESDIGEDENHSIYGFSSSSGSWDCKPRQAASNGKLFSTLNAPHCSRNFNDNGNCDNQTCFVMSSEEEDNVDDDLSPSLLSNIEKKESINYFLDEDSGMASGSAPNSTTDDEELMNGELTELVSLRTMNIGEKTKNRKLGKLRFNDFYKMVNDHLGSGAYACVRTAISLSSEEEYAVKLVDKREPGHTRSRIFREVGIFKLCKNHPNIVQLIEWFEDETYFYMVFEKMCGGPLLNHIQRKVCFTEQEASQVTRDIAAALKYLHDRGIAHRDVKPENILCTDPFRVSPVKLCDLDLASKPTILYDKYSLNAHSFQSPNVNVSLTGMTPGNETSNHTNFSSPPYSAMSTPRNLPIGYSEPDLASPVGSAEFMAPEVVDAFVGESLKYDKRCDMWSLGVIVYIMLCGYPPFYGECDRKNCGWNQGEACSDCQENLFHRIQVGKFDFPEDEWRNISAEAKDLICHLLVRNVSKRYTADDVLNHSWVAHGAPKTPLQTASNLFRNDSARDVHQMNQVFQVYQQFSKPDF